MRVGDWAVVDDNDDVETSWLKLASLEKERKYYK